MTRGARIELRGFFSPLSVKDMLANYRIVNGLLDYVRRNYRIEDDRVMDFLPPEIDDNFKKYATEDNFKVQGLTGGLSPARVADVYISVLKQAGLNPRTEYVYVRDTIIREAIKRMLGCQ
jgi:hypothetical protein